MVRVRASDKADGGEKEGHSGHVQGSRHNTFRGGQKLLGPEDRSLKCSLLKCIVVKM